MFGSAMAKKIIVNVAIFYFRCLFLWFRNISSKDVYVQTEMFSCLACGSAVPSNRIASIRVGTYVPMFLKDGLLKTLVQSNWLPSSRLKRLFKGHINIFGDKLITDYHRCCECQSAFLDILKLDPKKFFENVERYYAEDYKAAAHIIGRVERVDDPNQRAWCNFIVETIKKELPEKEKVTVLDVGCAEGTAGLIFEQNGIVSYGCDPCGSLISWAVNKSGLSPQRYKAQHFSCETFDGERFCFISCYHSIEHTSSPIKCLSDMYDSLIDGGILFLSTPCADLCVGVDVDDEPNFTSAHPYLLSKNYLETSLVGIGFEILEFYQGLDADPLAFKIGEKPNGMTFVCKRVSG